MWGNVSFGGHPLASSSHRWLFVATLTAKYGALSTQNGRVSIKWGQQSGRTDTRVLIWCSNGGRSMDPQLSLPKTLALG